MKPLKDTASPAELEVTPPRLLLAKGKVVAEAENWVAVSTERQSGCSGCQSQKGCGTATLAKLFAPSSRQPIQVENSLGAKVGDTVVLSMDESQLIKHSFMAYAVPLFGMFIGALLLQWGTHLEWATIFGGVFGLVSGWGLTKRFYRPEKPKLHQLLQDA